MNNSRNTCNSRLEAISLLAAGCLSDQEAREVREHFAECARCRERFAEVASLSSSLRAAKPAIDADSVCKLAGSLFLTPSPASTGRSNRSAGSSVAMLALAVLVLVGVVNHFTVQPGDHVERSMDVVQESPRVDSNLLRPTDSDSPLPTLLALCRAAAESDESFDRLLSRYSRPLVSEPIHLQSLFEESIQ